MKRRDPGDRNRIKVEKKNRAKSRSRMNDVAVAVYIRKDGTGPINVGACHYIGVLAKRVDDRRLGVKGALVAKVAIGKDGALHSGFMTSLTLLQCYEFFEEWDLSKPDHRRMLDYAASKPRTKKFAQELKIKINERDRQRTLSFTEAANKGRVETPDPCPPAKDVTKSIHKVMVNGVEISGELETVTRVVRDLVFEG